MLFDGVLWQDQRELSSLNVFSDGVEDRLSISGTKYFLRECDEFRLSSPSGEIGLKTVSRVSDACENLESEARRRFSIVD